jgi:hypothetical protein
MNMLYVLLGIESAERLNGFRVPARMWWPALLLPPTKGSGQTPAVAV